MNEKKKNDFKVNSKIAAPAFYSNSILDNPSSPASTQKGGNPFINDYTDDANKYSKDKKRTKEYMLGKLTHASKILFSAKRGSPEWKRARKVYEELRKYIIGDFTDDGDTFDKDKLMTKNEILTEMAWAYSEWMNNPDPTESARAKILYMELLEYAEGFKSGEGKYYHSNDFTDDGKRMNNALLQELVELFEAWGQDEDPAVNRRVERMFNEIKQYLMKELKKAGKKSDFMDDRGYPVSNRLISLMDQIYQIVIRSYKKRSTISKGS